MNQENGQSNLSDISCQINPEDPNRHIKERKSVIDKKFIQTGVFYMRVIILIALFCGCLTSFSVKAKPVSIDLTEQQDDSCGILLNGISHMKVIIASILGTGFGISLIYLLINIFNIKEKCVGCSFNVLFRFLDAFMMIGLFVVLMSAITGGVAAGTLGLSSEVIGFAENAKKTVGNSELKRLVEKALNDPTVRIANEEFRFDDLVEVIEHGKKLFIKPDVCNEYGFGNFTKFLILIPFSFIVWFIYLIECCMRCCKCCGTDTGAEY